MSLNSFTATRACMGHHLANTNIHNAIIDKKINKKFWIKSFYDNQEKVGCASHFTFSQIEQSGHYNKLSDTSILFTFLFYDKWWNDMEW